MALVWRRSDRSVPLRHRAREFWYGIAVKASYVLLQQLDMGLTLVASSHGLQELNPVMAGLLASPARLVVIKLVIPLFIAWLVPPRLLVPAIAFLVLVAGWNIRELLVSL